MRLNTLTRAALIAASFVVAALAAPAATLAADNVLTDNQIIQASLCAGTGCVDGETFTQPLMSKSGDTPGLSIRQTAGGGFTPYSWDIGGNEANFFVRDNTAGSRLPLRIRPNGITSQVDLGASGVTTLTGIAQQTSTRSGVVADSGSTILAALRTLAFERYSVSGTSTIHFGPTDTAFNTAFTLGDTNKVALSDMAAIALAAVKQLDARVTTLQLTPGPQGTAGATGATGATGAAGAAADLTAANRRIAALERTNKAQAKALAKLQKQMKQLLAAG